MVCVISEDEVGVDVEKIRPIEYTAISKRFLTSKEYNMFSFLPQHDKLKNFYTLWTAKESFTKALGTGLHTPLTSIELCNMNKITMYEEKQLITYFIDYVSLDEDYEVAICTPKEISSLITNIYSVHDLID